MALYTVTNLQQGVIVPPSPFGQVFKGRETKEISASVADAENDSVRNAINKGLIAVSSANDPNFPDDIEVGATGAAVSIGAGAVDTAELADDAVTAAKALAFVSAEQTATGASQNVAHGLGATPSLVLVTITNGHDGAAGAGTQVPDIAEGAHDDTNVVVTVTAGATFKVFAWA